ncbi:hypothetical protein Dimus_008726 [Dionaea muscipula]
MMSIQFHPAAAAAAAAAATARQGVTRSRATPNKKTKKKKKQRPPPVFISTNPSDATQNLHRLSQLYSSCEHSSHRFPNLDSQGRFVEPIDLVKLRVAISHSPVVVSVFSRIIGEEAEQGGDAGGLGWWEKWLPVTPGNGQLVGFGRAISDLGLTASIYDVMVIPSLQRMGIGRMIVHKIIRMLTSRGIYDISAVCFGDERLFFEACGFGDDILGSTTMMYSRTASSHVETCDENEQAGLRLLLPPRPS